jgi:hypothetical protein
MSAQANIVINDGAGTPVAHTFNPKGAKKQPDGRDVGLWRDQSPANAVGYLSITEQHADVNSNGVEKFRYVIDVPTTEILDGAAAPSKAYACQAFIEVMVPQRATAEELANIVAFVKNFTALTYFHDAIVNREAAW